MERLAAWVVLVLGALVLVGEAVRVVNGLRDDELEAPLLRLLVVVLVVLGMRRAVRKLRVADVR